MSYSLYHSSLCYDTVYHIYSYIRIPDNQHQHPTSHIIRPIFIVRRYLKQERITMQKIIYSIFFTKIPSAWLLNQYDEAEWEDHVHTHINTHRDINRLLP